MVPLQMAITLFLQLHVEGGWTKGKDSRYWIVKAEHCRDRACSRACASDQGLRSTLVARCFEDGGHDRHSLHCSRRCCCCRGVSVPQPPNYAPEAGFGAEGQLESRLPRKSRWLSSPRRVYSALRVLLRCCIRHSTVPLVANSIGGRRAFPLVSATCRTLCDCRCRCRCYRHRHRHSCCCCSHFQA